MKFKEFFERYFLVHKCGGCREILEYEHIHDAFCEKCMLKYNVAKSATCPICNQSAVECACMPKGLARTGAVCLRKLFFYSSERAGEPQNRMIYLLKKQKIRRVARFVAEELYPIVESELSVLEASGKDTVIVGVPRAKRARAAWGFDQSELISKELSSVSEIPYVELIRRKRGGKEQKKLDSDKRFRNTENLFDICEDADVNGKYVILFDDVVTTGASMAACVKLLRRSGAKAVICMCIAQD